ncbi:zinc finger protein 462-like isoform X1 [Sander lucioperca]|uniref:zinc finger protein 462-like isoform X1 n=1 Tax=Sander lucioperca TaxID=283035 RepID=UPI00125D7F32|nr:zinc finger protein 462-like isoform X1 [Sander lucioperca]XP_031161291.1 zinc finger protein 462-like isoform X1 [Sander lucioperca]
MQKDSMNVSTSGPMTQIEVLTQESQIKSLRCSHCTLLFKSKVYLFEHLHQVHGFEVDSALRDAGLKCPGSNKANTENHCNSSGHHFECQHCDFTACSLDVLNEHEKQCNKNVEDRNVIGNQIISENPETDINVISANQHSETAGAKEISSSFLVMSTSKSKCTLNSSKDLKTYKRPLQTMTKYFAAASGSNGKLADDTKLLDSTKGTILLQESPSSPSPNSSGVFKVTAKHNMIDTGVSHRFLLTDHFLNSDMRPPKPKEQSIETVPDNVGKRTNKESSKHPPAKKAKSDKKATKLPEDANARKQQSSSNAEFSFEVSEDEGENKLCLVNGNMESSKVYFCKHCDYSDMDIACVSTHYQNHHPYVRYNAAYIQDPSDESATFRCLQCPVEFVSVAFLKRHYSENHPEAPNVFTILSRELNLVFKCFVCPFTTNVLKALKEHYKENHPKHIVDNSLMYCRYSATGCQKGSSQSNACEKPPSPERQGGISPESACTPCKEVQNAPSPQHPTSPGANVALYHCNNCKFSHKSVVVMHVHYQKKHPGEEVTIDKIKQSACVTSHRTSQIMPVKSPNSVKITEKSAPQTNISDFFKKAKEKGELSQRKQATEASKTHSESPKTKKVDSAGDRSKRKKLPTKHNKEVSARMDSLSCSSPDKLFYCQFCSYSSTKIKSVIGHHNAKHAMHALTGIQEILIYSAEVQKKKLQSEAEASASTTSSDSKTNKHVDVYSVKELQHEEDKAANALVMKYNPYACAENLFYCQKCNYGNPAVIGVVSHQNQVHRDLPYNRECIIEHTAMIHDEIEKSKTQPKELSFSTCLPLPLMNEGDEDMLFCHFCNYRQRTMDYILRHYSKKHRGFVVNSEHICLYTSMVHEKTQKLHLHTTGKKQNVKHASLGGKGNEKTKKLGKSFSASASPSMTASQTQRTLQCHRCPYSTPYVNVLKRHLWKIHKANRSVTEVLRMCFKQGTLKAGYHCDTCVFSHKEAAAVYKHYQAQHPGRRPSLEYVTARLYVGADTGPPETKKPQIKHTVGISDSDGTDGSLPSQRSGQNGTKTHSCRACSFKDSSMSGIIRHYHAVHPWSVKEDGSVLNVIKRKRPSANRQAEDHNAMPGSFESYQEPLEFDMSPGSPKATASSTMFWCPFCPARFNNQHGLNVHCGIKHHEAVTENSDKQQEPVQTRTHVFKCPHCTYINTRYQGILTHCQMKHPALASRVDSHHVDEARLNNAGDCLKMNSPGGNLRNGGYMCETCPQICTTQKKLNKHCKKDHTETVAKTVPNTLKPAPKPSAVSTMKPHKTLSKRGSVSQASFLRKKTYAAVSCQHCSYKCTTKIALGRHLQVHHKNASMVKDSFLKYYAPVYKQAHEKQLENTREACKSSTTTAKNKKLLVYRCPSCPYINASYHGILTHCQMKHPDVVARADQLQTDEILVTNMVMCSTGKASNERGYMCKICPLIYASLKKLKIHCDRDHDPAQAAASEHSADIETEKQPDHSCQGSALEASKSKTSAVSDTEIGVGNQLGTPDPLSVQNKQTLYKCHICTYKGFFRRYLQSHYKKTHKLDPLAIYKLLEKYNKRKRRRPGKLPEAESEESAPIKCKKCPELMFDSSQLLAAHYSISHSSDSILDFTVLSQGLRKGSTGLYRCIHCNKQMNGIRKLWYHLDCHRESERKTTKAAKTTASLVITTAPEAKFIKDCGQDELLTLETVEELAQWNVTQVETLTLPPSSLSSPSKPTDVEQPQLESREDKHPCKQCRRTFMSLKGLRSHERSHAAVAAIKKLNNLPTSVLKHNINKYVLYKVGTIKPFRCSFCSYRTTVMGLWRSHFMKTHQDVISDHGETDNQDEESAQRADKELFSLSEDLNNWPEPDEEPEITEKSPYLEPPDVQRQLNHYNLMAQADAPSQSNVQETKLPDSRLLRCELCNFSTGHLSSMRRHYLNRHGKKILRCKDCDFFTGLRKTMEMHMETGHSTCQSEPTHQKDLRCPFCLYQTKNKNNMIDHIVLHREERVVPIEVRRSKLSRYLQGIVFRCHKCTFTSGSADNLRLHMTRHDDIKPYKCRLCYFDCTRLSDLEAHLSDKHQVVRNHELVGQVSLEQLQARVDRMPVEEPSSNLEHHYNVSEDVETEEFVTDCDEVPHETQAQNPAENNMREKVTLQSKEAYQKKGQDRRKEESPAKSSVLDLQYENTKPNTSVQEKHEQEPQQQDVVVLPAQPDIEDSSITFTQQKVEAADKSSPTFGKIAKEVQAHKPHNKNLEHKTLSIEARVEDDILRNIRLLDEDGRINNTHKKADQDRTVKTEDIETEVVDCVRNEMILLDEKGSIILAHNPKNQVNTEVISAFAKKEHIQANNSTAQESFTVKRHLSTPPPTCELHMIGHKESLGVSFTNCKKEQLHNLIISKEVRDPYQEMPVLENEYLKEEMQPHGCCKMEDQIDHVKRNQDKEDEMITEDDENKCPNQKHEGDVMKEAGNPHVPKGALTVTDGAGEVLCPAATEDKLFTCEFCGRNLMNGSELQRHIMRHGI